MSAVQVRTHVVGTFGQLLRSGPVMDTTVTPNVARDLSAFTVTATFYPPDTLEMAPFTRTGQGTSDGFMQYRLADGDLTLAPVPAVPQAGPTVIWQVRLTAQDLDENLTVDTHKIYVIPPEQNRVNAPTVG